MNTNASEYSYDYLGIQALPPRKKGRDRRRLNKAKGVLEESSEAKESAPATEVNTVVDPLSPYVEESLLNSNVH